MVYVPQSKTLYFANLEYREDQKQLIKYLKSVEINKEILPNRLRGALSRV